MDFLFEKYVLQVKFNQINKLLSWIYTQDETAWYFDTFVKPFPSIASDRHEKKDLEFFVNI